MRGVYDETPAYGWTETHRIARNRSIKSFQSGDGQKGRVGGWHVARPKVLVCTRHKIGSEMKWSNTKTNANPLVPHTPPHHMSNRSLMATATEAAKKWSNPHFQRAVAALRLQSLHCH